jgi:hypothetical protein
MAPERRFSVTGCNSCWGGGLPGIGKEIRSRPNSHLARNPTTGAEIKIPVKRVVEKRGKKVDGEDAAAGQRFKLRKMERAVQNGCGVARPEGS